MSYNISKKYLEQKYIKEQLSSNQIAKSLNASKFCILFNLKKYHIPRRTRSEAIKGKYAGKKNGNFKHGETLKKHYCACGNKISYPTFKYGKGMCIFCSNQGENNSNFNNWSSFEPYTKEFNNKLRTKIRKRDDYTCKKCGITEEEHIIVYGIILSVHHIDYDKENCKEENLITVCGECNTRANFNRNYWTEFFQNKMKVTINKEKQ